MLHTHTRTRTQEIQSSEIPRTEVDTRLYLPQNGAGSIINANHPPASHMTSPHYPARDSNSQSYPNKSVYYCVQSGGKPVYIPASVIHQARSRKDHQHSSMFSPPVQDVGNESSVQPLVSVADVSPQLYYTSDIPAVSSRSVQATTVNTTKPYAIVNAIPSSADVHVYSSHLPHAQQVMNPLSHMGVDGVKVCEEKTFNGTTNALHGNGEGSTLEVVSPTTSYPTNQPPEDLACNLQVINKKISAAFINCSEDMLISAFDDAWRKFQANGQKYSPVPKQTNIVTAPPNVEMVTIPGSTSSRLTLLRPVSGQKPRPVVPKANRVCALCQRDATYLCSGCRTEWYCGRNCQVCVHACALCMLCQIFTDLYVPFQKLKRYLLLQTQTFPENILRRVNYRQL